MVNIGSNLSMAPYTPFMSTLTIFVKGIDFRNSYFRSLLSYLSSVQVSLPLLLPKMVPEQFCTALYTNKSDVCYYSRTVTDVLYNGI